MEVKDREGSAAARLGGMEGVPQRREWARGTDRQREAAQLAGKQRTG